MLHVEYGHQTLLASFSGMSSAGETNVLSDVTPRSSALNDEPWNVLKAQERARADPLNVAAYVYIDPVFARIAFHSRLLSFPMADPATFRILGADLGCNSTEPAAPAPDTIPRKQTNAARRKIASAGYHLGRGIAVDHIPAV